MTLREKFEDGYKDYKENAKYCEAIADEFAIEFSEWMAKEYWLNPSSKYLKSTRTSELLEIFKNQKGL